MGHIQMVMLLQRWVSCAAQTAKALAGDIRERVKALGFARHKLIVEVKRAMHSLHTCKLSCCGTKGCKARTRESRLKMSCQGSSTQVTLSQQVWHTMRSVSRALWDTDSDGSASASFQNDSLICVGQVPVPRPPSLLQHIPVQHQLRRAQAPPALTVPAQVGQDNKIGLALENAAHTVSCTNAVPHHDSTRYFTNSSVSCSIDFVYAPSQAKVFHGKLDNGLLDC